MGFTLIKWVLDCRFLTDIAEKSIISVQKPTLSVRYLLFQRETYFFHRNVGLSVNHACRILVYFATAILLGKDAGG